MFYLSSLERLHLYTIPGIIGLCSYSYMIYNGSTTLKKISSNEGKETKNKP